jgi:hypothetical protein
VVAARHLVAVQIQHSGVHSPMYGRSGALGIAIVFTGLALACYGAAPVVRFWLWRAHALQVSAAVVDNVPEPGKGGLASWLPIVEFEAGGKTVMSLVSGPSRPQGWPLGGAVEVLYDPTDPHRARLVDRHFPISGFLIVGLGIVGSFLAVVAWRARCVPAIDSVIPTWLIGCSVSRPRRVAWPGCGPTRGR